MWFTPFPKSMYNFVTHQDYEKLEKRIIFDEVIKIESKPELLN